MKENIKFYIKYRNKGVSLLLFFALCYIVLYMTYFLFDIEIIDNFIDQYTINMGFVFYIIIIVTLGLIKPNSTSYKDIYVKKTAKDICQKYIKDVNIATDCTLDNDYMKELVFFDIGDTFITHGTLTGYINNHPIVIAELITENETQTIDNKIEETYFRGFVCDIELDIKFPINLDVYGKYEIDETDILSKLQDPAIRDRKNNRIKNYREVFFDNEMYRNNLRIECNEPVKCKEVIKPEVFDLYLELKRQLTGEMITYIRGNRLFIIVETKEKIFELNANETVVTTAKRLEQNISAISKFVTEFRKNF